MSLILISWRENSVLLKSRSEISVALNIHAKESVAKLRHVPQCFPLTTPLAIQEIHAVQYVCIGLIILFLEPMWHKLSDVLFCDFYSVVKAQLQL